MLSVSNDWINMFNNNVLNEALIKFVLGNNQYTWTKKDIFSYSFKAKNRYLCDEYPEYNATIVVPTQSNFINNYSSYIGMKVDIYYGYVINGSDEYVKAITLYIDDMTISDDGRTTTISLISIFAKLTSTVSWELTRQSGSSAISYSIRYSDVVYDCFNDYQIVLSDDYYIRYLPSKITLGNALQELTFINRAYLKLLADDYVVVNMYVANKLPHNSLNILKHPHITKMEQPSDVVVSYIDLNNTDNVEIIDIATVRMDFSYVPSIQKWRCIVNKDWNNSFAFVDWKICYRDNLTGATPSDESIIINNDFFEITALSSADSDYYFHLRGYSFKDYTEYVDGKTTIFNFNISNQTHANNIKTRVQDYLSTQKNVELELRINPALEMLDLIYYENNYKNVIIEEMDIDFNGGYRGRIKGRYDDKTLTPTVSGAYIFHYGEYAIVFTNPYPFPLTIYVDYNGGDYFTFDIGANATKQITDDDFPELSPYTQDKEAGHLQDDIFCFFGFNDGKSGDSIIIWGAD